MAQGRGRGPPGRGGAQAWKGCWIACWISLRETGLRPALRVHSQRPCGAPSGSTTFPHPRASPGKRSRVFHTAPAKGLSAAAFI